jgi:hypothetical protein
MARYRPTLSNSTGMDVSHQSQMDGYPTSYHLARINRKPCTGHLARMHRYSCAGYLARRPETQEEPPNRKGGAEIPSLSILRIRWIKARLNV